MMKRVLFSLVCLGALAGCGGYGVSPDTKSFASANSTDDPFAPVLALKGSSLMTLEVNTAYVEPGFQAHSLSDGNITSSVVVTGKVTSNAVGTYVIQYSVTDSAGRTASLSRVVAVIDSSVPTVNVLQPQNNFVLNASSQNLLVGGSCSIAGQPVIIRLYDQNNQDMRSEAVTCSSQNIYQVTLSLNGISDGSITVTADHGDGFGNFSKTATVVGSKDSVNPSIFNIMPSQLIARSRDSIVFEINYNDPNIVLSADVLSSKISLTYSGNVSCDMSVSVGNGEGMVTLTNCLNDGSVVVNVAAGSAQDAAGNLVMNAASSPQVLIQNTPPQMTIGAPSVSTASSSDTITFNISYSDSNNFMITLSDMDVSLVVPNAGDTVSCTAAVGPAAGGLDPMLNRTVTLTNCTGDGEIEVSIASGTAIDNAENISAGAISAPVTISNTIQPNVHHKELKSGRH